uniref:Longin domain-containing protein n=1 Tax=Oryza barthii TaxID=65489 RepID=A0A0D3FQ10_9ORYZ
MGVDLAVSGLLDKMVKLTMVARVTDGLPLAEGLDDGRDQKDADFYKQQAKLLFKNLSKGQHEASRMSIETGPYFFHYIIEGRVCYLTMCDRSYPKKLAFQYLEDLKNEFERVNCSQIETAARPYAFIKFGLDSEVCPRCHCDRCSFDALLVEEQDMVTAPNEGSWACVTTLEKEKQKN